MPLKIIVIVKAIHFFLCNTQNDPEKIKNHVEMLAKKTCWWFIGDVFWIYATFTWCAFKFLFRTYGGNGLGP